MSSFSPNSQKSEYERMLCVARALMSNDPAGLDSKVEFTRWSLERPELLDKWVQVTSPRAGVEQSWYVFVSADGWGKSQGHLPDGARVAASFQPRGEWSLRVLFRQMVRNYLSGIVPNGKENRARIELFERRVEACNDTYNNECIASFRRWLAKHGEHPLPSRPNQVVVLPQQLIGFCKDLATLRARYAADANLMGSISSAADLCMAVAGGEDPAVFVSHFDVFSRYAWFITSSKELHPVRIFNGIVQKAIREGFLPTLVKVADNYRERVISKIEAGRTARDIDTHLDLIYEAVPYAKGAHLIYSWLLRHASDISDAERQRFQGAERDTDETLVRLSMPFVNQVLDFGGYCWEHQKRSIDQARKNLGKRAAQERALVLVDRLLYYPEATLGLLLEP